MEGSATAESLQSAIRQMRELVAREGDAREIEESGYHCMILRNPDAGYLSGYVGIPRGHSLYGVDFNDVEESNVLITVHGGLEFSGPTPENGRERPDLWYFGFSCDHFEDLSPKDLEGMDLISLAAKRSSSYKTIEFVESEVRSLAQQLKAVEHKRVYR
jgi:hypothetical protein